MGIENWFWIGLVGGGICLLFALFQLWRLLSSLKKDKGSSGLPTALRAGCLTYLKWQLLLSGGGLLLVTAVLAALSGLGLWEPAVPLLFVSSGLCGLLSGLGGALIPVIAGPQAARAAGQRLDRGVRAAFSAGTVTGFFSVGLGLVHLSLWFLPLRQSFGGGIFPLGAGSALTALLFHMGTLFARSSEIAADGVDREMDLAPGSPWNPAVVARGVGQGVGEGAAMAALFYCVYENLLLAALCWGRSAFAAVDMAGNAALLPLATAAAGALLSLVGFLTLRPMERRDRCSLLRCLRQTALVPALLTAAAALPLTYFLMGSWRLYPALLLGLALGFLLPLTGELFTAETHAPARSLAEGAETGPESAAVGAVGLGAVASLLPLLLTVLGAVAAFWTAGGGTEPSQGVYGVALAGVGMLSTLGVTLAGAEMGPMGACALFSLSLSEQETPSPTSTDSLAAIGASAAGGGKLLAASAAGLAGPVLLSAPSLLGEESFQLGLPLLLGAAVGIMAVLLFSGLFLRGIRGAAASTLSLARRQLRGGGPGTSGLPDHAACIGRCSLQSLLRLLPALVPVLVLPPAVGLLLRARGLVGFSCSVLLLGIPLCLLLTLSVGALEGARRYVESGRKGGLDSPCHKVLLTADSVLAPLTRAVGAALPALVMASVTLALLCLPLVGLLPPMGR